MTIGIPRALAYHRCGVLWETFFEELDVPYIVSDESNGAYLTSGRSLTVDESCLPLKLYMGHAESLRSRCDALLVPRLERLSRQREFCVRFWGLPDTVRATFDGVRLLTYERKSATPGTEGLAFLQMARALGKGQIAAAKAYRVAQSRQQEADFRRFSENRAHLRARAPKILVAAQSYITYDPMLGGTVKDLIQSLGAIPVFIEGFDRIASEKATHHISKDLYWTLNREILGAIHLARSKVDGIILLTAFPCGSDCLANELVLRRIKDLPIIQILLDEHQSIEGLRTRIESFLDMIQGPM